MRLDRKLIQDEWAIRVIDKLSVRPYRRGKLCKMCGVSTAWFDTWSATFPWIYEDDKGFLYIDEGKDEDKALH